jgi:hypothetical protein
LGRVRSSHAPFLCISLVVARLARAVVVVRVAC